MRRSLLVVLLVLGCERSIVVLSSGTGGQGGSPSTGGESGGGGNPTTTLTSVCANATPFFAGSNGCYPTSAPCCDLAGTDPYKACYVATLGHYTDSAFCDDVPSLGGKETDYRSCEAINNNAYTCLWGSGTLLCCNHGGAHE